MCRTLRSPTRSGKRRCRLVQTSKVPRFGFRSGCHASRTRVCSTFECSGPLRVGCGDGDGPDRRVGAQGRGHHYQRQHGQTREGTTDDAGYYSIPNVLDGRYDLTVKMAGLRPYLEKGVDVPTNAVTRVNV